MPSVMPSAEPPKPMKNAAPLDRIAGMSADQIKALAAYWIISIQEFLAVNELPGGRGQLRTILAVDETEIDRLLERGVKIVGQRGSDKDEDQLMAADLGIGAVEPPGPMRGESYDTIAFAGQLPAVVSYVDHMPPIRNQGGRGTCVAHATAAVREFMEIQAGMAGADINLSEQFIYWWCKEQDNMPNVGGTYPHLGIECLAKLGTVTETQWPYTILPKPGDEGQGPPPPGALDEAGRWRLKRAIRLDPKDVNSIKTALADGKAVVFAIPVFPSWFNLRTTRRSGKINLPLPGEKQNGAHAMALVGYVDDPSAPGGGFFLLRNSWAPNGVPWGFDNPWAGGYGAIPYAFIAQYNMAAVTGDRAALADVYLRDNEQDQGQVPSPGIRCNSPDLWLRQSADGLEGHQAARPGAANHLYVRAWNLGPGVARKASATLYYAPASPSIWPQNWQQIGQVALPDIPARGSATASLAWTPPDAGPFCFLARLASPEDPVQHEWSVRDDNNIAQKNLVVLQAKAGAKTEFTFRMHGLPNQVTMMDLNIDRAGFPRGRIELRLAPRTGFRGSGRLEEDEARLANLQVQATDAEAVGVFITTDAAAKAGEVGEIIFTQHYGNLLVGRMTVRVEVTA